jgi:hypothetical protein
MTAKQVFEYALIELNKKEAPSLLLEDYNYFINKAVNQYINKIYNAYDINQQKSDDLRVLKSTAVLTPGVSDEVDYVASSLFSKAYEVDLPDDYLHILNCVVEYEVLKYYKCYNASDRVHFGAKRLTADMFSQILNNYYLRPTYKSPYFYINNVTTEVNYPTDDTQSGGEIFGASYVVSWTNTANLIDGESSITISTPTGVHTLVWDTDFTSEATLVTALGTAPISLAGVTALTTGDGVTIPASVNGVKQVVAVGSNDADFEVGQTPGVDRIQQNRYGNRSKVRMEVRYGKDNAIFKLSKVYIDYLKSPQFIRLSQEEIDKVEDSSQILEFPDYVCQEIVNELVRLLMENGSDPRLQTHIPINQSIAQPQQEQQAPQQRR